MKNKKLKKIIIFFCVISLIFSFYNTSYCKEGFHVMLNNMLKSNVDGTPINKVRELAQSAITITQVIGVGVALITLIVLAMKYMVSAPNERAEITKHARMYVIGAVVLFGSVGILEIIKDIAEVVN